MSQVASLLGLYYFHAHVFVPTKKYVAIFISDLKIYICPIT